MRWLSFVPELDLARACFRAALATTALGVASLLLACVQGGDTCPGFDAPEARHWASTQIGTNLRFRSSTGEVWNFQLKSVHTDAAGPPSGSESGIGGACTPHQTLRYVRLGANDGMRIVFEQFVPDSPSVTPPSLDILVKAEPPSGTSMTYVEWSFVIDPLSASVNQSNSRRYDAIRSLEGVRYQDVLEDRPQSPGDIYGAMPADPDAAWVRVVLARDIGLLQFELLDGRVFTRVQ